MRFGTTSTKWLKCFHLLVAAGWVGGALALLALHFLRSAGAGNAGNLHGIDMAAHLVDMWVIVCLGGTGCLLTGLLYSGFTAWGFFRHRWVLVKWIITLFCVLSGTFWLGPWEATMVEISAKVGDAALSDAKYVSTMQLYFWLGVLQIALLLFALFISVFKPWKGKPVDSR